MSIKVLNSSLKTVAILNNVIDDKLVNEINGAYTFNFTAIIDDKVNTYINENYIIEADNDYFDIIYYESADNEDGSLTMTVQCEHVSYRLNDETFTTFTYYESPYTLLYLMLFGSGFTPIDAGHFSTFLTYSITEEKTKRLMIFELASLLGGEVVFEKFKISIDLKMGDQSGKIFTKGKNIKVLKKIYDGRAEDGPITSYACESINIPNDSLSLGDNILLYHSDLDISEEVRIVKIEYSVIDNLDFIIHLSNKVLSLSDSLYRITTSKLTAERRYFGVKIGPDTGFEVEASDQTSRAIFNSDEFKMQKGDGSGNYTDKVYFDPITENFTFNGTINATSGNFSGSISASSISGGSVSGSSISGGTITGSTISGGSISAGDFTTYSTGDTYYITINDDGLIQYKSGNKHGIVMDFTSYSSDLNLYYDGSQYARIGYNMGTLSLEFAGYNIFFGYGSGTIYPDNTWDFSNCNINNLETVSTTYSGSDNHNHGISSGTKLAVDGGGYVTWAASGSHYHQIDGV